MIVLSISINVKENADFHKGRINLERLRNTIKYYYKSY